MVDLQESPATPPEPRGGDERLGFFIAGALLIALGWVFGVAVNLLLHWASRSSPATIWGVHISGAMGEYAWAVFGLGLVTGALGVAILAAGRASPPGKFVLPGVNY